MRCLFVLAPLLLACARSQATESGTAEPTTYVESPPASASGSELPADIFVGDPMYARLEEVGRTYEAGVIERLALSDIAFPANPEEALALQGYAVVMITATTHAPQELPPQRVYTDCGGDVTELPLVVSRTIPFETSFSDVVGSFRYDAFYLLPVQHVDRPECKLVMDWASNRMGQVITEFDPVPRDVPVLPPMALPPEEPIMGLLAREYPFLFEE